MRSSNVEKPKNDCSRVSDPQQQLGNDNQGAADNDKQGAADNDKQGAADNDKQGAADNDNNEYEETVYEYIYEDDNDGCDEMFDVEEGSMMNDVEEPFDFEDDDESAAATFAKRHHSMQSTLSSPTKHIPSRREYRVVSQSDLAKFMKDTVSESCEILQLSPEAAECLLRSYKWQSDMLSQDWLDSPSRVLAKAGFPSEAKLVPFSCRAVPEAPSASGSVTTLSSTFDCPVLAITVLFSDTSSLRCGHRFSNECWKGYLIAAMEEGGEAVNKRCPQFKCPQVVSVELWKKFLSSEVFEKFEQYRIESLVSTNPKYAWCPAPNCIYAVEMLSTNWDVQCSCGKKFCFHCSDEPHKPIPCDVIRRWHVKNADNAANVTWILVHTKMCPGCKRPIEKNQGCMHMKCRCGHEFCWMCMETWSKHQGTSYYRCNHFPDGETADKETEEKEKAKVSLEKYAHYFERYRAHNSAQQLAEGDQMNKVIAQTDFLHELVGEMTDVEFLQEALLQIIDCRRFLKWSYAYGYMANWSSEFPHAKTLFEYHQGQLESALDSLHEMTENFKPEQYVGDNAESFAPLFEIKTQLVNLTRVVKEFFKKMSEAFESEFIGAAEVDDSTEA